MGAEALQGTPCCEIRTLNGGQHVLTLEASDIFMCLNIHLLAPWILKRTTTLPQTSDCLLSLVLDLTLSPPNTAVHVNEAPFRPGSLPRSISSCSPALALSCNPSTTSDLGGGPAFSQAQFEVVFDCHEEVLEGHSCPVEEALQEKLLWKQGIQYW